jgi:hypothetical protein
VEQSIVGFRSSTRPTTTTTTATTTTALLYHGGTEMDFITGIIPIILIIGLIFIFSKKRHGKSSGEWDNKFQDLRNVEKK